MSSSSGVFSFCLTVVSFMLSFFSSAFYQAQKSLHPGTMHLDSSTLTRVKTLSPRYVEQLLSPRCVILWCAKVRKDYDTLKQDGKDFPILMTSRWVTFINISFLFVNLQRQHIIFVNLQRQHFSSERARS